MFNDRKHTARYKPAYKPSTRKSWLSPLEWMILFIIAATALIVALNGEEYNNVLQR